MSSRDAFRIAVLSGDGIGVDVTAEAVKVLRAAQAGFRLDLQEFECGAECRDDGLCSAVARGSSRRT